jgi:hypothetical protein
LERIWNLLLTPLTARLDMVLEYTRKERVSQLEAALEVSAAVGRAERLLQPMQDEWSTMTAMWMMHQKHNSSFSAQENGRDALSMQKGAEEDAGNAVLPVCTTGSSLPPNRAWSPCNSFLWFRRFRSGDLLT